LHAGVTADEILNRLRQNAGLTGPVDTEWTNTPLTELTRHIRERHHQYVRDSIPRVRALLAKIRKKHGAKHREIGEIEKLFGDVAREMTSHMQKEEQILFPYIDALERSVSGIGSMEPPFFQTVRNPIRAMMQEHDVAGELVRQIRRASNDYKAPADTCTSHQAAYQKLKQFEEDLHLHVHLENNILFPRAVELEAALV
jgi:regulator of cell morphogenesis and NO signaling